MSDIYRAPLCAGTALRAAACLSTKAQNELRRHRHRYCHSTDVDTEAEQSAIFTAPHHLLHPAELAGALSHHTPQIIS